MHFKTFLIIALCVACSLAQDSGGGDEDATNEVIPNDDTTSEAQNVDTTENVAEIENNDAETTDEVVNGDDGAETSEASAEPETESEAQSETEPAAEADNESEAATEAEAEAEPEAESETEPETEPETEADTGSEAATEAEAESDQNEAESQSESQDDESVTDGEQQNGETDDGNQGNDDNDGSSTENSSENTGSESATDGASNESEAQTENSDSENTEETNNSGENQPEAPPPSSESGQAPDSSEGDSNDNDNSGDASAETEESSSTEAPKKPEFQCKAVGRFPHPESCSKYYFCWDNVQSRNSVFSCSSRRAFDPVTKTCVDNFAVCESSPKCEMNKQILPDPEDSASYYECKLHSDGLLSHFELRKEDCAWGRVFDAEKGYCAKEEDEENAPESNPSGKFECTEVGVFIDFNDETRFYECLVKNIAKGVLKTEHRKCPKFHVFSMADKACVFLY